jgi:ATP-dependent Clp protease ATP-binding subunit ClpA
LPEEEKKVHILELKLNNRVTDFLHDSHSDRYLFSKNQWEYNSSSILSIIYAHYEEFKKQPMLSIIKYFKSPKDPCHIIETVFHYVISENLSKDSIKQMNDEIRNEESEYTPPQDIEVEECRPPKIEEKPSPSPCVRKVDPSAKGAGEKLYKTCNQSGKYGIYLTADDYITDPAIGREKEMESLRIALMTPGKSAILVGPPGVGKSAIVEGLSYRIQRNDVPDLLKKHDIYQVETSSVEAGAKYVGVFEEKVKDLLNEVIGRRVILFIDEIHTMIGAGRGENSASDFANQVKTYLQNGKLKMIGATTNEEYEKYIKLDGAFKRRFERIDVLEPEDPVVEHILLSAKTKYEHLMSINFSFDDNLCEAIMKFIVDATNNKHRKFDDAVYNPDLAITILAKSFSCAADSNRKTVTIEDISRSIGCCDRLNKDYREKVAKTFFTTFSNLTGDSIPNKGRVLQFPGSKE